MACANYPVQNTGTFNYEFANSTCGHSASTAASKGYHTWWQHCGWSANSLQRWAIAASCCNGWCGLWAHEGPHQLPRSRRKAHLHKGQKARSGFSETATMWISPKPCKRLALSSSVLPLSPTSFTRPADCTGVPPDVVTGG